MSNLGDAGLGQGDHQLVPLVRPASEPGLFVADHLGHLAAADGVDEGVVARADHIGVGPREVVVFEATDLQAGEQFLGMLGAAVELAVGRIFLSSGSLEARA